MLGARKSLTERAASARAWGGLAGGELLRLKKVPPEYKVQSAGSSGAEILSLERSPRGQSGVCRCDRSVCPEELLTDRAQLVHNALLTLLCGRGDIHYFFLRLRGRGRRLLR